MREREEIVKDFHISREQAMLEVLLDIRDLLSKNETERMVSFNMPISHKNRYGAERD